MVKSIMGTRNTLSLKYKLRTRGQICPIPADPARRNTHKSVSTTTNHVSRMGDKPAMTDVTGFQINQKLKRMQISTWEMQIVILQK